MKKQKIDNPTLEQIAMEQDEEKWEELEMRAYYLEQERIERSERENDRPFWEVK